MLYLLLLMSLSFNLSSSTSFRFRPVYCGKLLAIWLGLAVSTTIQALPTANSSTVVNTSPLSHVITESARQQTQHLVAAGLRVEIKVLPGAVTTSPCQQHTVLPSNGQAWWGRVLLRLQCQNPETPSQRGWVGFAPIEIQVFGAVLQAKQPLLAGKTIPPTDVISQEIDLTKIIRPQLAPHAGDRFMPNLVTLADLTQLRPVLNLSAGQYLKRENMQLPNLINHGDPLLVRIARNGFEMRTQAFALGSGQAGESIRVKTEQGKVLIVKILDEKQATMVMNE